MRKVSVVALVIAAGLVISGCVAFDGPIKGKQINAKHVRIDFSICDDSPSGNCEFPQGRRGPGIERDYVLLAFRAPKGTTSPNTFKPKNYDLTFRRSPSYTRQMNQKAPRNANTQKWIGYASDAVPEDYESPAKFKLVFGLPKDPGVRFLYRPAVGYASANPGEERAPRIECGEESVFDVGGQDGNEALCVDDPETKRELRKNLKIALD